MVSEEVMGPELLDSVEQTIKRVVKPLFAVGMTKDEVKVVLKMRLDKAYDAFVLNPFTTNWNRLDEAMTCWQYIITNPQAGVTSIG